MTKKKWSTLVISGCFFMLTLNGCATRKCIEKPIDDCVCTMQYDPVCGCNQKTYSNACAAECAGIKEYKKGPCEKL
jgi:hypothetical protein